MSILRMADFSEWGGDINTFALMQQYGAIQAVGIELWGGGPVAGRENVHYKDEYTRAQSIGMGITNYVWPPRDITNALAYVNSEFGGFGRAPVARVFLDVEDGEGIDDSILGVVRTNGYTPAIYGNRNSWQQAMGNKVYLDIEFWVAGGPYYDKPDNWPNVQLHDAVNLGLLPIGWPEDKLIAWQLHNTRQFFGASVDLSIIDSNVFEIGWENMTPAEQFALMLQQKVPIGLVDTANQPTLGALLNDLFWIPRKQAALLADVVGGKMVPK